MPGSSEWLSGKHKSWPKDDYGLPPGNTICRGIFQKRGQQREEHAFQKERHSCHQYEFRVSKHFLFPRHTICLNSSSSFYRSPNGSNVPGVPPRRAQISSLGRNGLPHRLLTFIISIRYQIQTPGWVHNCCVTVLLSSGLLLQSRLHPSWISLHLPQGAA